MDQDQKAYRTLEYDKILKMLAEHALCSFAKEMAAKLLPEQSLAAAVFALAQTDEAKEMMVKKGAPSLESVQSPVSALTRADRGGVLSAAELLEQLRVLRCARVVRTYFDGAQANSPLRELFDGLRPNRSLEERISFCIVSQDEINDHASSELAEIRRKIRATSGKARDLLNKMVHSAGVSKYLQDQIITMRGDRFVLPVRAEFKNEVPGIVHDMSGSGATLFIEPMAVVEANNEMRTLAGKEQAEIERILAELSAACAEYSDGIIQSYEAIAQIDFTFAKAKLSYKYNGCSPAMNDKGIIRLKAARHPLIDSSTVVPIDVRLGDDFNALIITGPNTGGKTVTLKTLGLFVLMAQSGLHIPVADGSEVSVFDHVLSDIGDEQSIEQSLSTFSAHMKNIVGIMDTVDERCLVLFDELGAGTDPVEGAALAISIIERVLAFGARLAATTHYAELKAYALKTPGVENGSCEFDVTTLRPTYKLLIGIPGRSNAFAISKRLGLSESIIERANELVSEDSRRFEEVLTDIEAKRAEMERAKEHATASKAEAANIKQQLEMEKEKFDEKKDKQVQKAREDAKRILSQAKGIYEQVTKELAQLQKEKDSRDFGDRIRETRARLKKSVDAAEDKIYAAEARRKKEDYVLPRPLKAGDTVLIAEADKQATVLIPPDDKGEVLVSAGIIKTKINVKGLRLIEVKPQGAEKYYASAGVTPKLSGQVVKKDLDLRGMTSDDALIEVDRFLDNALLMGLSEVTIIHGKGTGALRTAVTAHLKGHSAVKSYRLGKYGEGETGVTIVELR